MVAVINKFGLMIKFFKETRSEMKKVVWPERRYVMVATVIVLFLVVLTSVYVMTIDFTFGKIFGFLLK